LTHAEAGLVALSAAVAAGDADAISSATEEAILAGAPPAAIYESLLQSYLFVGFPRAIEALFAAGPVLLRHGYEPPAAAPADIATWNAAGESLCRSIYGRNFEKLLTTMRGLSPDLAQWMILEGYGKTLSRPGLTPVEREYCVVAILTATKMWRQLRSHAIGAVNVGGTRAGVRESIELCAKVAGEAAVNEALRVTGMEVPDARR